MTNHIDDAAETIHNTAIAHGFWDKPRNFGEMLMLVTSELAEALEEDRESRAPVWFKHTDDCLHKPLNALHDLRAQREGCSCNPKPEGALVELIDAIIRLLDTSQHLALGTDYTVSQVMYMKMKYNDSREYMHGKAY